MNQTEGLVTEDGLEVATARLVVSCREKDGTPTFFPVVFSGLSDEVALGYHYDEASGAAYKAGYEDVGLVYAEDDGPEWLFSVFNWETAIAVGEAE